MVSLCSGDQFHPTRFHLGWTIVTENAKSLDDFLQVSFCKGGRVNKIKTQCRMSSQDGDRKVSYNYTRRLSCVQNITELC